MGNLYFFCIDDGRPAGGIRKIYRHVDILNKHGLPAYVLHPEPGMRCSWFRNETPIRYARVPLRILCQEEAFPKKSLKNAWGILREGYRSIVDPAFRAAMAAELKRRLEYKLNPDRRRTLVEIGKSDVIVFPEIYGRDVLQVFPECRKAIFNQNVYYTFLEYPVPADTVEVPYHDPGVLGTVVVSEENRQYLNFLFPRHRVLRVRHGIDTSVFSYSEEKKRQVAFMGRKLSGQVQHILSALKLRGNMDGYSFVCIENRTESETARIMRESMIFLSFSTLEGFGLPPVEAMSCGCIVVGYHGNAGKEYFDPAFSFPVDAEDVAGFIRAVEGVAAGIARSPEEFRRKARLASEFVSGNYSMENEEKDVVAAWSAIFGGG